MKVTTAVLGLVFILFVCALPAAQAYHLSSLPDPNGRTVDVRNRVLATYTTNLDNAVAGNLLTFTFPWDPEYSYADVGHTIRVHVSYTATFPSSSNGAWTIAAAKEATGLIANCAIRVETVDPIGLTLDALLVYAHYQWDCLFTVSSKVHYHTHTIYLNRTVASGSPAAMTAEVIAVRLETEDIILPGEVLAAIRNHESNQTAYLIDKFGLMGEPVDVTTTLWPLAFATALLAICAMRDNPNYAGIAFSGLMFVFSGVGVPFADTIPNAAAVNAIRVFLVLFGTYLISLYAIEIRDFRTSQEGTGELTSDD